MINPLSVADKIVGLAGGVLSKIPDGNVRAEAERDLRIAIQAGAREWGPVGVASVLSVVALCGYALSIGYGFSTLDPIVLSVLFALVGGFFGLKFKEAGELAKKFAEIEKKRREEEARRR